MSTHKPDRTPPSKDPYRYRRAWSATARDAASKRIREVLDSTSALLPAVEAVGEAFAEVMVAKTVTITLLDDDGYWDLVNIGDLPPEEVRFPNERYPASLYPTATARLLAREGYISSDATMDVDAEHPHNSAWLGVGSFMGVPIVAAAEMRGEILVTRGAEAPAFLLDDLAVAEDMATQFGALLPGLQKD
ncbi:MAG: GAF domain-containing protein [Candidatus Nanopelagicales bacterium]